MRLMIGFERVHRRVRMGDATQRDWHEPQCADGGLTATKPT